MYKCLNEISSDSSYRREAANHYYICTLRLAFRYALSIFIALVVISYKSSDFLRVSHLSRLDLSNHFPGQTLSSLII